MTKYICVHAKNKKCKGVKVNCPHAKPHDLIEGACNAKQTCSMLPMISDRVFICELIKEEQ